MYRAEDEGSPILLLMAKEPYGFHLRYQDDRRVLDYMVPLDPSRDRSSVTLFVGGEPMRLPSRFFISRTATVRALREFFQTGGRSSSLEWRNFYGFGSEE